MSTIDVIIPCYNYAQYLPQCVESVLAQAGPEIRVLIIDDASTDLSAEVASRLAQKDARISLICHQLNKGHIGTYNEGLERICGDYVLLLSADDYVLPGAFQRAAALLDEHPNVGFVFGDAVILESESGKTLTVQAWPSDSDCVMTGLEFIAGSASENVVFAATAMVRREYLARFGGYRADLPHCADMELWFRLAARGDVGYIASPEGVYRRHRNNMSLAYMSTFMPDLKEREAVLDQFFTDFDHPASRRLYARAKRSLGRTAVGFASVAHENGSNAACQQLMAFARHCSAAAFISKAYLKFVFKRVFGLNAVHALRSLAGRKRTAFE
jgi:glycosyltransferase involved in cell wall biosynthesis